MDTHFIVETPNAEKMKAAALGILVILVLIGAYVGLSVIFEDALHSSRPVVAVRESVATEVAAGSPLGVYYLSAAGGLFFLPIPVEIQVVRAIANGHWWWGVLFFYLVGLLPSHLFDYWVGKRFSGFVLNLVSKSKVYAMRRWVNRYGAYAILFFNLLPLPSPILSFALGLTKYNPSRLFTLLFVGQTLKVMAIVGFLALF